jgi:DNA-binding GntR family transcriptional regulator
VPLRDSYELPSERVEAGLRRRLAEEWHSGERLPPLSRLAAEFDVSQGTVARVLRKLAAEDPPLVRIRARWGAFRT